MQCLSASHESETSETGRWKPQGVKDSKLRDELRSPQLSLTE